MATTAAALMVEFGTQGADRVKRDLADVGSGVANTTKNARAGGLALIGFAGAVAGGFGLAIKSAMSYEQGLSGVEAALGGIGGAGGLTIETMRQLDAEAIRIGETTTQSATGAAQAMELLAKSGVTATEILNGAAQAAVNLGEATGEALPQAASTMGSLLNLFEGLDPTRAADVLTTVMNNSDATLSEMQTGYARLAPVIAATNMGIEDSGALLAYFNSQGISAAEVGTSLTSVFNSVTQPTTEAAAAMEQWGVAAYDANGQFVGFPALFDQITTATQGMTDAERDAFLGTLFTADAMDVATLAVERRMEGYDELRAAMDESGTAEEASRTRMNNLAGDAENLKGVLESIAITVGRMLTPSLRRMTQGITSVLRAFTRMPSGVQRVVVGLVAAAAAVAALAGVLGLLSVAAGPLAIGFGALAGAVAILLSPIGLLAAALVGLGIVFRGPIGSALSEIGDRLGEFFDDIGKVYDRLREGTLVYDEFNDRWMRLNDGASMVSAAIRAFGSALEDLTGIEMSAWFATLAGGVDTLVGAVGDLVSALTSGDWDAAWAALGDIGTVVINGAVELGGDLKELAGNLWGWVKRQILGPSAVGDGTGGPMGAADGISVGDVLVIGGLRLGGMLADWAGNIWGWVESQLVSTTQTGDGTGGPGMQGREFRLGNWKVTLDSDGEVDFKDALDFVDTTIEQFVGLDVELQSWTFKVKNPSNDLTVLDVWDWIDTQLEEFTGLDVELQDWTLTVKNPATIENWENVIDHIDRVLERMFAGGHDIELQNPIRDLAGTIRSWLEPAYTTLKEWAGNIRGAWAEVTDALSGPQDVIGMDAWGGTRGNEVFGPSISMDVDVVPVVSGDFEADVQAAVTARAEAAGIEVAVPVNVAVELNMATGGSGMLNNAADLLPETGLSTIPGGTGPAISLMVQADTAPAREDFAALLAEMEAGSPVTLPTPDTSGYVAAAAAVTAATLAIESRVAAMAANLTNLGIVAGQGFNSGIVAGTSAAVANAGAAAGALSGIFSGVAATATNMGFIAGQGFASGIQAGMGAAVAAAYAGAGSIQAALSINLYGQGANASQSFAAGLWSGVASAQAAASALAYAAASAVASQLLIRSPSRVFRDLAENTVEGFLIPLRNRRGEVASAMGALVGAPAGVGLAGVPVAAHGRGGAAVGASNVRIGQVIVRNGDDFERRFLGRSRARTLADNRS